MCVDREYLRIDRRSQAGSSGVQVSGYSRYDLYKTTFLMCCPVFSSSDRCLCFLRLVGACVLRWDFESHHILNDAKP